LVAQLVELRPALREQFVFGGEPLERDLIACQKIAQVVTRQILPVADDRGGRSGRLRRHASQLSDAGDDSVRHRAPERRRERKQFVKHGRFEAHRARVPGGASVRKRRRAQRKRNFPEVFAVAARCDHALEATDTLGDFEAAFDDDPEGRNLAFMHHIFAVSEVDVGCCRCDALQLVQREGFEYRHPT